MLGLLLGVLYCISSSVKGDDLNTHFFQKNFSFGVATSAYQIEGAWNEDGKGEQLWDWWTHTYPDKISNHDNGDIACDSYHGWQEDVSLMKDLGVTHYKVSIAWSRILPDGLANNNTMNQKGIEYYRTLFKALVDAGITPYVTLYHWDIPLPLHQLGGWQNPLIADHFAAYARICFEKFGDIVKNWITINEPHTYCVLGYATGEHAPGYKLQGEGIYKCAHTTLLAHAKAYHIYDDEFRAKQKGKVTIVIDTPWYEAKEPTAKNLAAVRRAFDFSFGLYANPIYIGNWPERVISTVERRSKLEGFPSSRLPAFTQEEIAFINGTSDFFCLNSYATFLVEHQNSANEMIDPDNPSFNSDQGVNMSVNSTWVHEDGVDWVYLVPDGFRQLLNYVHETYKKPILVTENGWADSPKTATIHDDNRITYIKQYLSALLGAIDDGVPVLGYTVWSLMDNFEWAHGYQQKLGLIQVDFKSPARKRNPKKSYDWYKKVISTRCLVDKCH